MKWKYLLGIAVFLMAVSFVVAQQPTMVSLQGKVTDPSGSPTDNGNLRVTLSTSDSCEQNVIYDYTYNNLIQGGLFSILLGNDSQLNMTYNNDYYLCTYVNGQIVANSQQINRTKFRGGQGQIPTASLANGTLTNAWKVNGNLSVNGNLTVNGTLLINGTAMVNGTPVVTSSDAISNIHDMNTITGSLSIGSGAENNVVTWQPAVGEVWEITHMTINAPIDRAGGAGSKIEVLINNGSFTFPVYDYDGGSSTNNLTLVFGNNIIQPVEKTVSSILNHGFSSLASTQNATIVQDRLYISNANYLQINVSNGDINTQDAEWFVQGTKIKSAGSSNINDMQTITGSLSIGGSGTENNVVTWQPAVGEVWEITHMTINAPIDRAGGAGSKIEVLINNGSFTFPVYDYDGGSSTNNLTLVFGNNIVKPVGKTVSSILNHGFSSLTSAQNATIVQDKLYISNANYLQINVTNGDINTQDAEWFVQGIRVK